MTSFQDQRPLEDWEYPDPESDDADDAVSTRPCPMCGAEIYEDAPQCPVCGEYVLRGSGVAWQGRPGWWILLGLLGVTAVIYVFLRF